MQASRILKAVFLFFLCCIGVGSVYAADTFVLDPQHTYVLWKVNHFGFSNQVGKGYASGTLLLDQSKPQNSKVSAVVVINNILTGLDQLDRHLEDKLFFDSAQFPTATFVSNQVQLTGKNTAEVKGMLTLHGVTKPIILHVKLNQIGKSLITDKMTAGFSATATLKRSDFGITTLLPGVSDEVELNIEAEASLTP